MSYRIRITRSAEQDLKEAAEYIEFVLKNPQAADHLLDLAEEKINSLADNPAIYPLADDPVLNAQGIRFVTVNHYLAFYTVDEGKKIIIVVRFLYGKRNWIPVLKQDFRPE